ncbi:MAG: NADH-quinone oxidoreductase subunit J, partial [Deltaproteobacteria bacterium]|nr:NADH-quinone oxidoreductase subunit J [Deltaproteobacteria bacterium]
LMSALWLIVCLASTAGLFALLAAPFVAILQILVYAGAVMVLFLFVIMLIDLGPSGLKARVIRFRKVIGAFAAVYLAGISFLILSRPMSTGTAPVIVEITPKAIGELMLTRYMVPFEVASVLLLAAVVGAVVMGKKKL